jgi:hypothetical protein
MSGVLQQNQSLSNVGRPSYWINQSNSQDQVPSMINAWQNANMCADACQAMQDCIAMTWVPGTTGHAATHVQCHLYSTRDVHQGGIPVLGPDPGKVSWVKPPNNQSNAPTGVLNQGISLAGSLLNQGQEWVYRNNTPSALAQRSMATQQCPALDCATQLPVIVDYYNKRGKWANQYTMEVNPAPRTAKIGPNQCDVLYFGNPVQGVQNVKRQQDNRRFTLVADQLCNWTVTDMSDFDSGSFLGIVDHS